MRLAENQTNNSQKIQLVKVLIGVTFVVFLSLLVLSPAHADDAHGMVTPPESFSDHLKTRTNARRCPLTICPEQRVSIQSVLPNESFLKQYSYRSTTEFQPLRDRIMDPNNASSMRRELEDMTRDYETREHYDLTTQQEKQNYYDRISGFTKYVLRVIFHFQFQEGIKKAEKNSEEVRTFRKSYEAAGQIVNGQTSVTSKDNKFKFGTKTNLPKQYGQVWMKSSYVNGSFDLNLGQAWSYDLWQQQATRNNPDEVYKLSLSREIPMLGLDSGVSYGGSTTRMTASLGKQLTSNLRAEVYAMRPMDPARANLPAQGEEAVRFSYGITF